MDIIKIDKVDYYLDTKRKVAVKVGSPGEMIKFMELVSMYDRGLVKMKLKDIERVFFGYYN